MGYVAVVGDCYRCRKVFGFSPTKVPSAVVDGVRQPLCEDCVAWLNRERVKRGLEPITILPGAYEGDDENEVTWD